MKFLMQKWDEKCRHLDMYDCGFIDKDELYIACKEADIPKARRYKKLLKTILLLMLIWTNIEIIMRK